MTKSKIITAILSSFLIANFLLFWSTLSNLYTEPLAILSLNIAAIYPIIWLSVAAILIICLITLLTTLRTPYLVMGLLYSACSLISLVFFRFNLFILFISLCIFLVLFFFTFSGRKELENHLKFSLSHIFSGAAGHFLTALSIIVSLGYYPFTSDQIRNFKFVIPEKIYSNSVNVIVRHISLIKEPGQKESFEEIAKSAFEKELPRLEAELDKLNIKDPQEREKILKESKEKFFREFEEQTGKIKPEEITQNLLGPFKNQLEERLNHLIDLYRSYLPAIFAVSLFAILKLFSPFIIFFSLTLARVIIFLFKILRIITYKKITREVEEITFS